MSHENENVPEIGAMAKKRMTSRLGELWWAILLRGMLAIFLAICAFAWPEKTVGIMVKLLGAYLLIDGLISAIGAYRSGQNSSPLIISLVSVTIGLVLLFWAGLSAKLFLVLVGLWLAIQGIGVFLAAMQTRGEDDTRRLTMTIGGMMTLLGLTFVMWPKTGIIAISWLIGFAALLIGCLLIYLAIRVKRFRNRVNELGHRT